MRLAPSALLLAAAACSHPDYGPPRTRGPDANLTVSFLDAAPSPPLPKPPPRLAPSSSLAPTPPPPPLTPVSFEDVVTSLTAQCDAPHATLEQGAVCRQGAMKAEMALLEEDAGRAIAQHQAAFARYVDAACSLVEETFWLDFDAGRRDDGTHDVVAWPTCRASAFTERVFFARALSTGNATALARWIEGSSSRGQVAKKRLASMRAEILALSARDAGPANDAAVDAGIVMYGSGKFHPLDEGDDKRLSGRTLFVQSMPATLARDTCSLFPELAAAIGGDTECREEVTLYYFAHAQYGRVY